MIVPDSLYILTSSPELAPETTIQPALPYIFTQVSDLDFEVEFIA